MDERKIACALGWFSLGLGLAELAIPGQLARSLGVRERNKLTRGFGLREIAAGSGILATGGRKPQWLWSRVAGDALDLGGLIAGLKESRKKAALGVAIASVAAITALDVYCGAKLQQASAA